MNRLDPFQARAILRDCGADPARDFHAQSFSTADALANAARTVGYREPRNANGSRARYFFAYLCRIAAKAD